MNRAFSMMELIFVIVIMGILAGFVIPKVIATGNDAKVSTALSNLKVLKDDLAMYYSKNNVLPDSAVKFDSFTNVRGINWSANDTISFAFPRNDECIFIKLDKKISTIIFSPSSNNDVLCKNLMIGMVQSKFIDYKDGVFSPKQDHLGGGAIYNIENIK